MGLRHQYLGSIPLISVELHMNQLQTSKREKAMINQKLETIRELENDMKIAKEELFLKLEMTEHLSAQLTNSENRVRISDWFQEKCSLVVQVRVPSAAVKLAIHYARIQKIDARIEQTSKSRLVYRGRFAYDACIN